MKKIALLIDANALIHRAWHSIPPMTSADGVLVNAVYGFTSTLIKVLSDVKPTHVVLCWDTPEPTYRHIAEPTYKALRVEQPQELYDQIPIVKSVAAGLGISSIELPGYEADDILGTLAEKFSRKKIDTLILSSDRDLWQLISSHVHILAFKKGVTETITYDEKMLLEVTGLHPAQIIDFKAMRGDSSDNLKGIPGIGEKTATTLLQTYGTLKGIFKAARDKKSDIRDSIRKKILSGEKAGNDTLHLVRIDTKAPLKIGVNDMCRKPIQNDVLKELFLQLGFKSLSTRIFGKEVLQETKQIVTPIVKNTATDFEDNLLEVEVKSFLSKLKSGTECVIHAVEQNQSSLFGDSVLFILLCEETFCVITRQNIESKLIQNDIREFFKSELIKKIGHDIKRCWHIGKKNGLELCGIFFDTQIASYLLSSSDARYNIDEIVLAKLHIRIPIDEKKYIAEAQAIWKLFHVLQKDLIQQDLYKVLQTFELPLVPILGEMEYAGILIDKKYFVQLTKQFSVEKKKLEEEMIRLAGEAFNPASPQQLSRIVFDVLQIPSKGIKRGKTGISTAATELEKLEGLHPIITKISEFREVAKLLSTYVETLPAQADAAGRIHTTYNMTVAATGRLSSMDPNLQNIPVRTEQGRMIRRGFVAAPGMAFVSCDYSQIELRVIAALSQDRHMLEAFNNGADIHTETATAIWHIDANNVTKDQRRAAKAINFGVLYGQGPQGLSKTAGVSFAEAKNFIDAYFLHYSAIASFLEKIKNDAHTQGYVETFFGRKRFIPEIHSSLFQVRAAAERMAINTPIQGTAADIMKLGLIEVAKKLSRVSQESRILLQVHDELVLEVPEKDVKKVAEHVKEWMAGIVHIGCPIIVESKSGKNWDEMDEIK